MDDLALALGCDPLILLSDEDTTRYIHSLSFLSSSDHQTPAKNLSLLTESFDIDASVVVKSEACLHDVEDDNETYVNSLTLRRSPECGPASSMPDAMVTDRCVDELTPEADTRDSKKCMGRQPLVPIGNLEERQMDESVKGRTDDSEFCSRTMGCTKQV